MTDIFDVHDYEQNGDALYKRMQGGIINLDY